jgi:pyruvate dehydrogenase E1 component alpha subunit
MTIDQRRETDDRLLTFIADGEGRPDAALPEQLDTTTLLEMFKLLVLLRTFDERAVALQRQGHIGNYPSFWGEEATQVGPVLACDDADWLFPTYRQGAIGLARGLPPSTYLKYRSGRGGRYGFWNPREYRVAPILIPIATNLPHAVGLAWAAKIKGERTASLVWFGDGATSEGDFHEAMNFASVYKVATVFFCVNNQWAISTPVTRQTATRTIAEKAAAYAMPCIRVDGFDAVACWHATKEALQRGREGGGPTLVEAQCYRIGPHASADDPSRYRDESEAKRWRTREPVQRFSDFLRRHGVLDESTETTIREEARRTIRAATDELHAAERPGPEIMFDYVYSGRKPWPLEEGLAEFRNRASPNQPNS